MAMFDETDLRARYPNAQWCDFGDSAELSDRLLGLIRTGKKTATCGALRDYEADGDPVPRPGDILIARDANGAPALVYEITECTVRPFNEVPEDFALAEGEGSFDDWRRAHIDFFTRTGGFAPDMRVVCERFRLLEVVR